MFTAGVTANTTEGNSRASRESGLLCSHSHGESIAFTPLSSLSPVGGLLGSSFDHRKLEDSLRRTEHLY